MDDQEMIKQEPEGVTEEKFSQIVQEQSDAQPGKDKYETLFASSGCMQSIMEYMPYGDLWKLNGLNKRFYNQIVPSTMTSLGINPRIGEQVHLYDGTEYQFSFSRVQLEGRFPFRVDAWPGKEGYFEHLRRKENVKIEVGSLQPCSQIYYRGWTVKEAGQEKYRHGFGRQTGDDGSVYFGTWNCGKKTGYACVKYRNGNEYVGQVEDSTRMGYGTMYYENGVRYVGEWWADEKHGKGRLINQQGAVTDTHWDHDSPIEDSPGYQRFKTWQRSHQQRVDQAQMRRMAQQKLQVAQSQSEARMILQDGRPPVLQRDHDNSNSHAQRSPAPIPPRGRHHTHVDFADYSITNDLEYGNEVDELKRSYYVSVNKLMQATNLSRESAIGLHFAYEVQDGCFMSPNFSSAVAALHYVKYEKKSISFDQACEQLRRAGWDPRRAGA